MFAFQTIMEVSPAYKQMIIDEAARNAPHGSAFDYVWAPLGGLAFVLGLWLVLSIVLGLFGVCMASIGLRRADIRRRRIETDIRADALRRARDEANERPLRLVSSERLSSDLRSIADVLVEQSPEDEDEPGTSVLRPIIDRELSDLADIVDKIESMLKSQSDYRSVRASLGSREIVATSSGPLWLGHARKWLRENHPSYTLECERTDFAMQSVRTEETALVPVVDPDKMSEAAPINHVRIEPTLSEMSAHFPSVSFEPILPSPMPESEVRPLHESSPMRQAGAAPGGSVLGGSPAVERIEPPLSFEEFQRRRKAQKSQDQTS